MKDPEAVLMADSPRRASLRDSVRELVQSPRLNAWLISRPLPLLIGLDLAMVAVIAAAFLRLGDADLLFLVVAALFSLEALVFDVRTAAPRIVLAIVAVTLDLFAPGGMRPDEFFIEWPLMLLIAAIIGLVLAARRDALVRHYLTLYRLANDRLLTAQEDERRRLALDLHDDVAQSLTGLAFILDGVGAGMSADDPVRAELDRARELAEQALADTRDVADRLRPGRLVEMGLVPALRELAVTSGLPITVRIPPDLQVPALSATQTIGAYRVVQEALNNVARHSEAEHVWLEVSMSGHEVRIAVRDDGRGFDRSASAGSGLGLGGMEERAAMIGARLRTTSTRGLGTLVEVFLPLGERTMPGSRPAGPGDRSSHPHDDNAAGHAAGGDEFGSSDGVELASLWR